MTTVPDSPRPCPTCGKPLNDRFMPFCCARCADVDLGRWFTESYVVHTQEQPAEEDEKTGE